MCRKLMWCYVLVLTLLDLSLNSKLTAQGKSHGATVHDSLVEGITFQEWGTEAGAGGSGGRALAPGSLRAWPPALSLGRAALGAARAATVTLTNTANTTMHLASVAGTTPDFHASFFDSKTLACGANTSFSVVYLGRREGPVSAHLYIHTSLGVHKYPVSAVGVASEWGLWPLVDVRVPQNATLRPLLTMYNPTPHTVQVQEIYSSVPWLGLQLPDGGESAPRAAWAVPPHSSRDLVRLRITAPVAPDAHAHAHDDQQRAAYIRIKANVTGPPLVVLVEARAAPPGDHALPLQLRAGTRGAHDPPYTFEISVGNSAGSAQQVVGGADGARCRRVPHFPPAPQRPAHCTHCANGGTEGAQLSLTQSQFEPYQEPIPAGKFTFDFAKLWSSSINDAEAPEESDEAEAEAGAGAGSERWCAGWAGVGGSALPYSVRLLPGTLRLPEELHFVTANEEESMKPQELRAVNEFAQPVHVVHVDYSPELLKHFDVTPLWPVALRAGAEAALLRVRLRAPARAAAQLAVRTNLTHTTYTVRVHAYSGKLDIEWLWPNATSDELHLGALGTSSTRRVEARVRNPAPTTLCAAAGAALPGATLALPAAPACLPPAADTRAVLTVVAPARPGPVRGAVWLRTAHAQQSTTVTLHAHTGHVRADLQPKDRAAAPFAPAPAWTLVAESSMALRMRLQRVQPRDPPDPALQYIPPEDTDLWIGPGRTELGSIQYVPERGCGARCYTGGVGGAAAAWVRRALHADLALWAERRARFRAEVAAGDVRNVSLYVDTSEMVRIPVTGSVRLHWPRLTETESEAAQGAGWAGLAGVGAGSSNWLRVRNPSHTHPLMLHALVAPPQSLPADLTLDTPHCESGECVYANGVFTLAEWRAPEGGVTELRDEGAGAGEGGGGEGELPALLLAPRAVLELRVAFTPHEPSLFHAQLFLRNNLTVVEVLRLAGRGAVPSFELAGRRAGAAAPLLLQVSECEGEGCEEGGGGDGDGARWTVRRTLLARNTGAVPLRLRAWRLAGEPCRARGFRLAPCAPLALAPNESRALTLEFRADCSLARVTAPLTLRAGAAPAAFRLLGAVPARLLPACAKALPRPPWEPALRAAGTLLALAALALVLAAAALDAERLLRRARDRRSHVAARAPLLDLRALARDARDPPPAPPPAPPARRRRPPRRPPAPLDPHAERRAFERWRASVLRRARASDESSQSSSSSEPPAPDAEPSPPRSSDEDSTDGSEDEPPPRAAPPPRPPPCAAEPPPCPAPRRDASPPPRRADPPARPRAAPGKHHTRKDKAAKRRGERPLPAPARPSPPLASPRAGAGAGAGASPSLRWGASWSSVVAAGSPPPAPRASPPPAPAPAAPPRPAADHSLFYFNDAAHSMHAPRPAPPAPAAPAAPPDDFAWRAAERSPFDPPREYRVPEEPSNMPNNYGTIGSVWSAGADEWLWGAPVRPPPGFGPSAPPPPAAPAPQPVRAFDPFHSLASIWAPGAFDWRVHPRDPRDPPPN